MRRLFAALLLASGAMAQSAVYIDLTGPWRAIRDDRPEYASANFDDSGWKTVRLPGGISGPRYWLRRTVHLPGTLTETDLTLTTGTLQDVFEVYVNGRAVGASGNFDSFEKARVPQPQRFSIPREMLKPDGVLQIAIRGETTLGISPDWRLKDTGPWAIQSTRIVRNEAPAQINAQRGTVLASRLVLGSLSLLFGLMSLCMWQAVPSRVPQFWLGLHLITAGARELLDYFSPGLEMFTRKGVDLGLVPFFFESAFLAMFALSCSDVTGRMIRRTVWAIAALPLVDILIGVDGKLAAQFRTALPALIVLPCIAIFAAGRTWIRTGLRPWFSARSLLWGLTVVQSASYVFFWTYFVLVLLSANHGIPAQLMFIDFGDFRIWNTTAIRVVVCSAMLWLLMRNWTEEKREMTRLAGEMEAARAVQQLLLTGDIEGVDAVYTPAQEVGGDFYQVLDLADGERLVAVGDVSGKGLRAAMVVSLVVGLLRSHRELSPGALLAHINRQLLGTMKGGFVTCLLVRLAADGNAVMANAGHLMPYSAGIEVAVESGLPLGIAETEYAETTGRFESLMLLSDGVVEAAKADGELFGFERVREMSSRPAAEIAEAARAWGQNDDITVVTVGRMAA